jgi:hypothetical protein
MFPQVRRLFDEEIQLFWERWRKTVRFQNSQYFVSSDTLHSANPVAVPQKRADLGWADTFFRVVKDEMDCLFGSDLQPMGFCAAVRNG